MFPRKITAQSVCKTVPFRRGKGHPANVYKFTRVGPPSRSFQGKRDAHLFCTSREDILEAGLCDSFPLPLLSTQSPVLDCFPFSPPLPQTHLRWRESTMYTLSIWCGFGKAPGGCGLDKQPCSKLCSQKWKKKKKLCKNIREKKKLAKSKCHSRT